MRLLVTRPEPGASILAEELRELGHEPILQPLLEFRALNFDPAKLRAAQALIITSGNCLRALEDMRLFAHLADVPLYCVGEETARRAQATGFKELLATATRPNSSRRKSSQQAAGMRLLSTWQEKIRLSIWPERFRAKDFALKPFAFTAWKLAANSPPQ